MHSFGAAVPLCSPPKKAGASNLKTHGGKREGAGRKPLPASLRLVPVTIRLTQTQLDTLRQNGDVSKQIRALVEKSR